MVVFEAPQTVLCHETQMNASRPAKNVNANVVAVEKRPCKSWAPLTTSGDAPGSISEVGADIMPRTLPSPPRVSLPVWGRNRGYENRALHKHISQDDTLRLNTTMRDLIY